MNQELTTKLVLASVLAGFSTIAGATTIAAAPAENSTAPAARQELVVSHAARVRIEAKLQRAAFSPETLEDKFLQVSTPKSTFIETGPTDAEPPIHVPLKL